MKLHYYPETDSLYIELRDDPSMETREIAEGVLVNFDAAGKVIGLDIDGSATRFIGASDDVAQTRPS